jgi:hypothetical protein
LTTVKGEFTGPSTDTISIACWLPIADSVCHTIAAAAAAENENRSHKNLPSEFIAIAREKQHLSGI